MDVPLQITFRDFPHSDALEDHVRRRVARLDGMFDHVIACHVALEEPHRQHRHGKQFRVRIDLFVPGAELVFGKNTGDSALFEDAYTAMDAAFDGMERILEDYARRVRGEVKRHASPPHARVAKLFRDEGYGFLETQDGREIYFHKNSVLNHQWNRLQIGTDVRFAEEDGDKGPQASTVAISGKHPRREPRPVGVGSQNGTHEVPSEDVSGASGRGEISRSARAAE